MKCKSKKVSNDVNLIVLGNGFDLACGEKTSIFDFVNSILRNPNNTWSHYQLNFIVFLIYYMADEKSGNRWKDFLNLNNAEFNDWMDFEKIVYHLVLDEKTYDLMESIYNDPKKYELSTDKAAVFVIAQYFLNFREWHHDVSFSSSDSYLEFLEKVIFEFERELGNYLMRIDSDLKIYANKELLLRKLRFGYKTTSVMDFNYTRLPYDPDHHVYRIHGTTGTSCIIGIDPYYKEPGINNVYKTLGTKMRFAKVYKRLKYSSKEEFQQLVLRKNINRITFFGHSLGEQDYSYFQSVFDYINLYESEVVLVFCYIEYDKEALVKEVDRLTQRVFKLINRYGETLTNKDHGNNLLNKLLLEGRLVFRELDTEEIFNQKDLNALYKQYEINGR